MVKSASQIRKEREANLKARTERYARMAKTGAGTFQPIVKGKRASTKD